MGVSLTEGQSGDTDCPQTTAISVVVVLALKDYYSTDLAKKAKRKIRVSLSLTSSSVLCLWQLHQSLLRTVGVSFSVCRKLVLAVGLLC